MVLICLLVAFLGEKPGLLPPAILLLVVDMVWPNFYYYPAKLWFGLAYLMSIIMSKVIFTLLFLVLVVPVGAVRRLLGADAMQIGSWKKATGSVFTNRNCTYEAKDIERPY
ncbi:MAG: hypothetical protein C4520_04905 [Candidatus Abyssobacteria bacterium SURF_5]|uniref:Uncharacterized protein n=1 Tax=Abyssobacteria bacterium (strain SURF_5) TaxID=2093360 RepID=A0A3A4P7S2_ABYX5|nr:MAG: hypothetical protein C4520_04905 [Candidatus Abyssubacteria bacterium SURF_5]